MFALEFLTTDLKTTNKGVNKFTSEDRFRIQNVSFCYVRRLKQTLRIVNARNYSSTVLKIMYSKDKNLQYY